MGFLKKIQTISVNTRGFQITARSMFLTKIKDYFSHNRNFFIKKVKTYNTDDLVEEIQAENDDYDDTNKTKEQIIDDYIDSRFEWLAAFFRYTGKVDGSQIHLYRKMSILDIDKYISDVKTNKKSLGIYWTWNKESAEDWSFWTEKGPKYIFHGITSIDNINYKDTLEALLNPVLGSAEQEIQLKKNSKINVISIYFMEERKEKEINIQGRV